ncbi:hypothetical protein M3J09_001771 [Ascochyta lentis]
MHNLHTISAILGNLERLTRAASTFPATRERRHRRSAGRKMTAISPPQDFTCGS